jgi:hypothetical protein
VVLVKKVPQYETVTIKAGAVWSPDRWRGYDGIATDGTDGSGILAFVVKDTLKMEEGGFIDATGR